MVDKKNNGTSSFELSEIIFDSDKQYLDKSAIYTMISEKFVEPRIKSRFVSDVKDMLKREQPVVYDNLRNSLEIVKRIFDYEKYALDELEKNFYGHAADNFAEAFVLSDNKYHRNKAVSLYQQDAIGKITEGHQIQGLVLALSSYNSALDLNPLNQELRNGAIQQFEKAGFESMKQCASERAATAFEYAHFISGDIYHRDKAIENYELLAQKEIECKGHLCPGLSTISLYEHVLELNPTDDALIERTIQNLDRVAEAYHELFSGSPNEITIELGVDCLKRKYVKGDFE